MLTIPRISLMAFSCAALVGCALPRNETAPVSQTAQMTESSSAPAPSGAAVDVATAAQSYFGSARGDYIVPDAPLSEQLLLAMGIPDNADGTSKRLASVGGGLSLQTGCRQHNCQEKGAVVTDQSGNVVGAGLIHFRCKESGCDRKPILTIFASGRLSSSAEPERVLLDWANSKYPGIGNERRVLP
ncbi:hypothetical protein [Luteimonas sp. R10]|uniref:hypothetical protein n=1 Tax=Luteimonas sp. R10 TaxID=3108176 RepID=UPI00308E9C33|nr:hypothetical protein U3649_11170 [Luteimonas sp. R10]